MAPSPPVLMVDPVEEGEAVQAVALEGAQLPKQLGEQVSCAGPGSQNTTGWMPSLPQEEHQLLGLLCLCGSSNPAHGEATPCSGCRAVLSCRPYLSQNMLLSTPIAQMPSGCGTQSPLGATLR